MRQHCWRRAACAVAPAWPSQCPVSLAAWPTRACHPPSCTHPAPGRSQRGSTCCTSGHSGRLHSRPACQHRRRRRLHRLGQRQQRGASATTGGLIGGAWGLNPSTWPPRAAGFRCAAGWRWWRHGPADSGRIEWQWRSKLATRHWYGLQHPETPVWNSRRPTTWQRVKLPQAPVYAGRPLTSAAACLRALTHSPVANSRTAKPNNAIVRMAAKCQSQFTGSPRALRVMIERVQM